MLPVVYDPVVAQAIERYSHQFERPDGVYLSIDDIDGVETALRNYGLGGNDVDLLVATDAEEILGIGDWGANGMDISIGKLAVYSAAAGIDPDRVIPVMLDVGTDRESLLNDPLYVGNRHSRVRGERYDQLIKAYIETASRLFPNALLHFEDFGPSNARRILNEYRDKAPVFNDDVQGTGAITLAGVLAGMRVAGTRPREQRVVIFGAGTAGVGIADQIRAVMIADDLSEGDATQRFWCVDKQGLLVDDMNDLRDFQEPYARPRSEVAGWGTGGAIGLAEVVAKVHPTIIVGTSTVGGAFTEQVVREMAKGVERPLIFPLSNPTELIEAVPADVIRWTDGRGLVGTGTPWAPVSYKGVDYAIGQANNALVYPGIGLGTIVARASRVTDEMLLAAAEAVAGLVDVNPAGRGTVARRGEHARHLRDRRRGRGEEGDRGRSRPGGPARLGTGSSERDVAGHVPAAGGDVMATTTGNTLRAVPIETGATRTRCESDSMGQIGVPAEHYWGAQTQRSLIHFSIGDDHMPKAVYHAYGYVKKAAALLNADAGRLDRELADAIVATAEEVIAGKIDSELPLYV